MCSPLPSPLALELVHVPSEDRAAELVASDSASLSVCAVDVDAAAAGPSSWDVTSEALPVRSAAAVNKSSRLAGAVGGEASCVGESEGERRWRAGSAAGAPEVAAGAPIIAL